jgi:[acyl-carrier-protein] S-malonyltransferase
LTPSTALLFPGQGSQTSDMRETVERHRGDLLELVQAEVGDDPFVRAGEGTAYAQPAIYCASLAGWAELGEPGGDCVAGHSLGEFAALVAAGCLSAEDGLRLVVLRGRLMQRAAASEPGGGMLALRTSAERGARLAERTGLSVANDNSPEQVVLSGPATALEAGLAAAERDGIRAKRLPIAGAFHSPAMQGAAAELESALGEVEVAPPNVAVISGVTAEPVDDVRRRLAEGVVRPVRWRETLLALYARGVRRYLEVGPGKVLTGLVRRTLEGVDAETADALEPARA